MTLSWTFPALLDRLGPRCRMGGDVRQANQAEKEEVAQAGPATMLGRDGGFGSLYGHGWVKSCARPKAAGCASGGSQSFGGASGPAL